MEGRRHVARLEPQAVFCSAWAIQRENSPQLLHASAGIMCTGQSHYEGCMPTGRKFVIEAPQMGKLLPNLFPYFAQINDPRRETKNKRHLLEDILVLTLYGVLVAADDWQSIAEFGRYARKPSSRPF